MFLLIQVTPYIYLDATAKLPGKSVKENLQIHFRFSGKNCVCLSQYMMKSTNYKTAYYAIFPALLTYCL
jgi:hypothetical protein